MQYPNPEEPDFGPSPKPTAADYIFGGMWTIVGIGGLIVAHVEGQLRRLGAH